MKSFIINKKTIIFGSNAKENTELVKKFKELETSTLWFHLSDLSSSHGFYTGDEKLSKEDLQIIGNILLKLSKITSGKNKMDICDIKNVEPTNTNGLVTISKSKKVLIKFINCFKLDDYKL